MSRRNSIKLYLNLFSLQIIVKLLKIKPKLKCNSGCDCHVHHTCQHAGAVQDGSCAVNSGLLHVCAAPDWGLMRGTPLPGMTNLALIITWLLSTPMSSQPAVGIVLLVYLSNETLQSAVSIVSNPGLNDKFGGSHVLQTTFSNYFSLIKIVVFSLNVLRTQNSICSLNQHSF